MKLIKIDRLRGLSIGCLVGAAIMLIGEVTAGQKFEATFFIITMIILSSALEEMRLELRELRDEIAEIKRARSNRE